MGKFLTIVLTCSLIGSWSASCTKCNCTGEKPRLTQRQIAAIPFENDTSLIFSNGVEECKLEYVKNSFEEQPKNANCDCVQDYFVGVEYLTTIEAPVRIFFRVRMEAYKDGNYSSYSITSYGNSIFQFTSSDSSNVNLETPSGTYADLYMKSLKDAEWGSNDSLEQIYFSNSLGLVAVQYTSGKLYYLAK